MQVSVLEPSLFFQSVWSVSPIKYVVMLSCDFQHVKTVVLKLISNVSSKKPENNGSASRSIIQAKCHESGSKLEKSSRIDANNQEDSLIKAQESNVNGLQGNQVRQKKGQQSRILMRSFTNQKMCNGNVNEEHDLGDS